MFTTVELLRNVSMFETLSDEQLSDLAQQTTTEDYAKDSVVVTQGEPGRSVFFVKKGRLKAVLSNEGGREITLSSFGEGDFFGEMSLLDGQPRSATIITTEDSTLVCLRRVDFVRHLNKSPQTAINILAELSLRLRKADEVIGNLALLDVSSRLNRQIAEIADLEGEEMEDRKGAIFIPNRPTHQDLASMIGTRRETVSRALVDLQKQGLIIVDGKGLILLPEFFKKLEEQ